MKKCWHILVKSSGLYLKVQSGQHDGWSLFHEGDVYLQDTWGCFLSGGVESPLTRSVKTKCHEHPQIFFFLGFLLLVKES